MTRSRAKAQDQVNPVMENIPTHQDEGIPEEGLPILVHVERLEGGPMVTNLFQKDVICEVIRGCVQEYPVNLDILSEMKCAIEMPKEMVASIVVQDLQSIRQWGVVDASVQCTIACKGKMKTVIELREKDKESRQPEVVQAEQVNAEDQTEVLVGEV